MSRASGGCEPRGAYATRRIRNERAVMQSLIRTLLAVASLGTLDALPPATLYAQPATAPHVITAYMTTEEAYNTFSSAAHPAAPPKVTAFPLGDSYVAMYFTF